jgi:hypothetical protein
MAYTILRENTLNISRLISAAAPWQWAKMVRFLNMID